MRHGGAGLVRVNHWAIRSRTTFLNQANRSARALVAALAISLLLAACQGDAPAPIEVPGGDNIRGAELIVSYGCGECHYIPGIAGANGRDAPGLQVWPNRGLVAGAAPNRPENVIAFLVEPNSIQPGSAMPDLGISEDEARDITAYLFTIGGR